MLTFCVAFVMAVSLKLPGARDPSLDHSFFKKLNIFSYHLPTGKKQFTFFSCLSAWTTDIIHFFSRLDQNYWRVSWLMLSLFLSLSLSHCLLVFGLIPYFCFLLIDEVVRCNKALPWYSLCDLEDCGFGGSVNSLMHQFQSLFVCGFLPFLPYCFAFSPSPFPPFQENGGVAPLPPDLPRFSATRVAQPVPLMLLIESWLLWMLHLPQDVILSIEIPGVVPCCLDDFLRNILESLKKGNFRANNQLGIMTIHPSHSYQHGSSWGLQNDALPASAGSQVMMSLKSVWPVSQELR